jgi:hypothetical protein
MVIKLRWIFPLTLTFLIGCKTNNTNTIPSSEKNRPVNGVTCFSRYYFGVFGDDQKAWSGVFYMKQNLSVVAHLPTKSEFFIAARELPDGNDVTNGLKEIVNDLKTHAGASQDIESWETLSQTVVLGNHQTRLLDFNYLHSEFTGTRIETDSYSKSDRVNTTIYATAFTAKKAGEKPMCFISVAMIPVEVSLEERQRLIAVLRDFLEHKVSLFAD